MEKTFKREISLIIFAIMLVFGVWSVWEEQAWRVFEVLVFPSFALLAGALSLDWTSKQRRP